MERICTVYLFTTWTEDEIEFLINLLFDKILRIGFYLFEFFFQIHLLFLDVNDSIKISEDLNRKAIEKITWIYHPLTPSAGLRRHGYFRRSRSIALLAGVAVSLHSLFDLVGVSCEVQSWTDPANPVEVGMVLRFMRFVIYASALSTCLHTSFNVSKRPIPWVATASKKGYLL